MLDQAVDVHFAARDVLADGAAFPLGEAVDEAAKVGQPSARLLGELADSLAAAGLDRCQPALVGLGAAEGHRLTVVLGDHPLGLLAPVAHELGHVRPDLGCLPALLAARVGLGQASSEPCGGIFDEAALDRVQALTNSAHPGHDSSHRCGPDKWLISGRSHAGAMHLKHRLKFAAHILKEERALARASKNVPKPVPWDWAKPRLVPLLAGPRFDRPGDEVIRATAGPGCAIEIAMDLGTVQPLVDVSVAQRWECTPEQLRDAALANLRARLAKLPPAAAAAGTLSGRIVRILRQPRACAASIVLLTDELIRLFGPADQVFAAPTRDILISFPINTPPQVIADAVIEWEMNEAMPLMSEPFVLLDGQLHWQPPDDEEEDFATRARSWPTS
jgi:hypothetical protein